MTFSFAVNSTMPREKEKRRGNNNNNSATLMIIMFPFLFAAHQCNVIRGPAYFRSLFDFKNIHTETRNNHAYTINAKFVPGRQWKD